MKETFPVHSQKMNIGDSDTPVHAPVHAPVDRSFIVGRKADERNPDGHYDESHLAKLTLGRTDTRPNGYLTENLTSKR